MFFAAFLFTNACGFNYFKSSARGNHFLIFEIKKYACSFYRNWRKRHAQFGIRT